MGLRDRTKPISCTECQRRKQKCSKEWPCNHCQARKLPHLCQFGQAKSTSTECASDRSRDTKIRKRSNYGSRLSCPATLTFHGSQEEDSTKGLKALGYMPGHLHFHLGNGDSEDSSKFTDLLQTSKSKEVEKVIPIVPSRFLTDLLVNHFLYNVNNHYNTIYPPTFVESYTKWWTDRGRSRPLDPDFTCLLLRVCAYSAQYLTPPLKNTLEYELTTSAQNLTERFNHAAEQLSATFTPETTSLIRVQDLFMKGIWLNSESLLVQSWHNLGVVIREAQELGFHTDTGIEGLTEFEIEIRRRLWSLLYIWDWQMSAWLGRPRLINGLSSSFTFPSLRLDESKDEPKLLSPFAHIVLQSQLARTISKRVEELEDNDASAMVSGIDAAIHDFIDNLPAIFRLINPDTSLDKEYSYFVCQRCQLHVVIYLTLIDPLKPYLAKENTQCLSPQEQAFHTKGIGYCLDLLQAAKGLFDVEYPSNAKFHLVIFSVFDTATFLCSALIHDKYGSITRRDEVLDALDCSLEMLLQLSPLSKMAFSSYKFLLNLIRTAPAFLRRNTSGYEASGSRKMLRAEHPLDTPESHADAPTHTSNNPLGDALPLNNLATAVSWSPSPDIIGYPPSNLLVLDQGPDMFSLDITPFDWNEFFPVNAEVVDGTAVPEINIAGVEQIWG
ncbi:hypothetical protein GQ43DRAFT_457134 [Delitschia confertaspora ATCC 74209]|uniref:Zn(2)-C6 fungal-type domain-containing protein n=1 Tax=Delitschia confertaspora ATCC 74209 TaxID=1513339 RepID=A0A9P4MNH2_9PLEO|nr:hypothetical protein GQ43DRAFT_457134 [Delitschia confertaspora ATCC 74209]